MKHTFEYILSASLLLALIVMGTSVPFPKEAQAAATITYLQSTTIDSSNTTFNFTGENFGSASSDRVIIVVVRGYPFNPGDDPISSATIGGVSATVHVDTFDPDAGTNSAIISAPVPTGTSGTVSVTFVGTNSRARISVYHATGIDTGATAYDTASNLDDVVSMTIDIPDNGILVAGAHFGSSGAVTTTGVTEDDEASLSADVVVAGSAGPLSAETNRTVSFDGATGDASGVAVSWSPAAEPCDSSIEICTDTFSSPGYGYWVAPANVYSAIVACWGAGGGADVIASSGGGGGGGGGFASSTVAVSPGTGYTIFIGTGGTGGTTPTAGGASTFATTTVAAAGGTQATNTTGGAGGSANTGNVTRNGGAGGNGSTTGDVGGGGGGAAGPHATGGAGANGASSVGGGGGGANNGASGNASGTTGGTGGPSAGSGGTGDSNGASSPGGGDGGSGAFGGGGGGGGDDSDPGGNGGAPGGGGGGGEIAGGGNGGNGQCTVTYQADVVTDTSLRRNILLFEGSRLKLFEGTRIFIHQQ